MVSKTVDPATRLAALADLRKCLEVAEEIGELEVIEGADPHLEMGALYELSLQKPIPPILLFRKIKGFPGRLPRRGQRALLARCSTRASGSSSCRTTASTAASSPSRSRRAWSTTGRCSRTC